MKEEAIPKTNISTKIPENKNITKQPLNKSVEKSAPKTKTPAQTPEYKSMGKEPISQSIKEIMPSYLIPTERLATILGLVFLAVITLSLIQLPYDELLKGNLEIKVGYPLPFLDFGIETIGDLPIRPLNLIIDLIIYLILSYIIDVIISLMLGANTARIRRQEGKGPKVYKPAKPSIAEKAVKKMITSQQKVPKSAQPLPNNSTKTKSAAKTTPQ